MDQHALELMIEQELNAINDENEKADFSEIGSSNVDDNCLAGSSFLMSSSDGPINQTSGYFSLANDTANSSTITDQSATNVSGPSLIEKPKSVKDIFYCPNYFDLNDILSQSQRLSVKFQRSVPRLGFLDSANNQEGEDRQTELTKGTKLELPLWVVKELYADHAVTVAIPKGYNQTYREILEADANCVNLNKIGPNYYRFGQHLAGMNLPESENIAQSLLQTFADRFHRIVNYSLCGNAASLNLKENSSIIEKLVKSNPHGKLLDSTSTKTLTNDETINELNQFSAQLDNWEKQLLETGQTVAKQMKRWENRDMTKVETNKMIVNLKKRKRLMQQHQPKD